MTAEATNIVLEHLQYIRLIVDGIERKANVLTARVSSLEQSTACLHVNLAKINNRLDNFDKRLDRIERRLEIQE